MAYEALAQRFSTVREILDDSHHKADVVKTSHAHDPEYSVIITPSGEDSVDNVKKEGKNIWRGIEDIPTPGDVVVTKAG